MPLNSSSTHTLCILRPFLSSAKLLVTPVVAVLDDPSILGGLRPSEGEVDRIFTHPLDAILDPTLAAHEPLVEKGSDDWLYDPEYYVSISSPLYRCIDGFLTCNSCQNPSDIELAWLGNSTYRMHRFRSSASAIKGLTAEILVSMILAVHVSTAQKLIVLSR